MNRQKFAVIGIGQFGSAIARALTKSGAEVMAIDNNNDRIQAISEDVAYAVTLDATDQKALLSQDIQDYSTVVVAIGQNFEQELMTIITLKDLGISRVLARARGHVQRRILEKIGIKEIFSPEDEVGIIVAERLLNPNLVSYLQLPDDYRIAELIAPKGTVGRTLGDIDLRDRYKLSLVTIKKGIKTLDAEGEKTEEHIHGVPESKTVITDEDCLVVFGKHRDIDRFLEVNT
jgi:trk system potassium uptake protein TrkA